MLGIYDIKIYEFEFFYYDLAPRTKKLRDDRVSVTLIGIIAAFLSDPLRVLVYICDMSDGKHKGRQELFNHWHKKYSNNTIIRIPLTIETCTDEISVLIDGCILTRKDFPYPEVLETQLIDQAGEIMLQKIAGQTG